MQSLQSLPVDVSTLGAGELSVRIVNSSCNNEASDVEIDELGKNLYNVCFVPNKPGLHKCTVMFNQRSLTSNITTTTIQI